MIRFFSPEATIISLIVMGIMVGISKAQKKSRRTSVANFDWNAVPPSMTQQRKSTMRKITEQHSDCSAEIFSFCAFDKNTVNALDDMDVGDRVWVELNRKFNDYVIFANCYEKRLDESLIPPGSHLKQVLQKYVPCEAYLGGKGYIGDGISGNIIVFYKLDGVPPTKVELEG